MQIAEYTFAESVDSSLRQKVTNIAAESETLDQILERWVLRHSGRLSIGEAFGDGPNDGPIPHLIALGFDDKDGKEIGCCCIERSVLEAMYPDIPTYDRYVIGPSMNWMDREVDAAAWERWLASLGMSESYALMARIGPRSAALPYALAFALSGGGIVECREATDRYFPDEDMLPELAEENLNLDEYFRVSAAYYNPKFFKRGPRWMMDPVYFKRTDAATNLHSLIDTSNQRRNAELR